MEEPNTMLHNDKLYWYKDAIIYELHIKAFRDSNGDGIGDFQGLIEKLDYLKDLGVTAIWVLPFYPSPLRDDGYDIADYYNINPSYGDIKQFKRFLKEAHSRNLKVITELVINHTSDQHPWFQRARRSPKGSVYRNYYVWTDNPNQYKGVRIIFQDFESSNWTWDEVAQQYYWHRFFHHQPDLNYDSPEVQQEVFKIIDYWCRMGVDGFRLDAVPYLFEREGTNCENLPETHEFLKKLRKHVDEHFAGTVFLAEANMWPEDSASYFGNGDECHMNYHFPVMPRMFMAMRMEDRYPITDIFDQTPQIPETCQWAIFLRNHDELTLEMVTDEERDYMYKVYAKDPQAKINLGIRHRLAPLMDNNRRKIELMNYLLFSLPGTPVIYYGDEIGMGDNFYLGDRDGVRTPMQWTSDRNAGFSHANPHKLYLPLILDPEYNYEAVNVEMQQRNTSSLLWWMKRVISTRKKYKAFSRGDLKFVNTENPKVLAFTRTYKDETILVIANLSRFSQPAELDLRDYKGYLPVEVFSKNKFPSIKDEAPYFFAIGPHSYYWFVLQKIQSEAHKDSLPSLSLNEWKDLLKTEVLEELEVNVLPGYLSKVKWFSDNGRVIQSIKIVDKATLLLPENSAFLLLVEVSFPSSLPETYQLPVAFRKGEQADEINHGCPQAAIAKVRIGNEDGILYDAFFGQELQQEIIKRLAGNQTITQKGSSLHFTGNKAIKKYLKDHDKVRARALLAEYNNTAIIYDNRFFLKLYRKVEKSVNPEVEILQFLKEVNFTHIPDILGVIEWEYEKERLALGIMQNAVENSGDARAYMLERLNSFYEKILSQHSVNLPFPQSNGDQFEPLSYNSVSQDVKELISEPAIELTQLLGTRTGEMHLALSSSSTNNNFKPEEFSLHYQRSLYAAWQSVIRETFQNLARNIPSLPNEIREEAQEVLAMKDEVQNELKKIYQKKIDVVKIRIHGDYHLGQILFTGKDYVITDFEGNPARSYSERGLKRSPLRDVASMIRSFHYVAYGGLFLNNQIRKEDVQKLIPFTEQWHHTMSRLFFHAYLETVKDSPFIPKVREDMEILIRVFIIERALHELNHELNNRPEWAIVPIRGLKSVMKKGVIKSNMPENVMTNSHI